MHEWLVLAAIGIGTYLLRAAFLVAPGFRPPAVVARALPLVAPAVLGAITLPALVAPRGTVSLSGSATALVAALVVGLLWRLTKRMPLSLLGGLTSGWALTTVTEVLTAG